MLYLACLPAPCHLASFILKDSVKIGSFFAPKDERYANAENEDCRLENIYRLLYNRDLYLRAYGRIYSNQGASVISFPHEQAQR